MKEVVNTLKIAGLAFVLVGVSALFGFSEGSGLFGAIIAIGGYLLNKIDG